MARAIPVGQQQDADERAKLEAAQAERAAQLVAEAGDDEQYLGKTHPVHGEWNGRNGWHKSHKFPGDL